MDKEPFRIKRPLEKVFVTIALALYALIVYFSEIRCPIFALTGIRCIGCGMTRALFSAVCLDFVSAFEYHFMFWSLPLLYLGFLYDGKLFKKNKYNYILFISIAVGFMINWLYNLIII